MFKARKIILTIFAAAVLLMFEITVISKTTGISNSIDAVIVSEDIQQGEIITKNKLSTIRIFNGSKESIYITDINEINGKSANRDMKKGEIVLKESTQKFYATQQNESEDTRYFSLELRPDQANSWNIKKGQIVDILFVPDTKMREQPSMQIEDQNLSTESGIEQKINFIKSIEKNGEVFRLKNIAIDSIFDESGKDVSNISSRTFMPRYISLKVRKGEDDFLAAAKKGGTLHISVLPTQK